MSDLSIYIKGPKLENVLIFAYDKYLIGVQKISVSCFEGEILPSVSFSAPFVKFKRDLGPDMDSETISIIIKNYYSDSFQEPVFLILNKGGVPVGCLKSLEFEANKDRSVNSLVLKFADNLNPSVKFPDWVCVS